jgi:hypothetical protein
MCWPQPAQVTLPQAEQRTGEHMGYLSLIAALHQARITRIPPGVYLCKRRVGGVNDGMPEARSPGHPLNRSGVYDSRDWRFSSIAAKKSSVVR